MPSHAANVRHIEQIDNVIRMMVMGRSGVTRVEEMKFIAGSRPAWHATAYFWSLLIGASPIFWSKDKFFRIRQVHTVFPTERKTKNQATKFNQNN